MATNNAAPTCLFRLLDSDLAKNKGDGLRKQTRSQENALEAGLATYSKLAASASTAYSAHGSLSSEQKGAYGSAEQEVQEGLGRLGELVDQMATLLANASLTSTPSTAMQHTARRHQEIVQDYTKDLKRIQSSLREAEQRANLLGSVREEISAFRAQSSDANTRGLSDADRLLNERGHIDNSHRIADDVLGQAYATRHEFNQQRGMLTSVNTRMTGVLAQIPGINSILSMINSRRRRDSLIIGSIVAVCTLILLWMVSR